MISGAYTGTHFAVGSKQSTLLYSFDIKARIWLLSIRTNTQFLLKLII